VSVWISLKDGFPNGIGSEGGKVRLDEEHPLGARITLEEGGAIAPWSITCGIYGWMCHTVFCGSEAEGRATVQRMKTGLDAIMDMIPPEDSPDADMKASAVVDAIEEFVADF